MTEKLQQTIKEELSQLPKEMQEGIAEIDWVKTCEAIGEAYFLDENQITNLQTETLLVLVDIVDPEFYALNIENHVQTTKSDAENMAREAFAKIFTPIRKILEENIKKNLKNKNPDHQQNLDFILSGGDYSVLIGPGPENSSLPSPSQYIYGEGNLKTPTLADIQANIKKTNI